MITGMTLYTIRYKHSMAEDRNIPVHKLLTDYSPETMVQILVAEGQNVPTNLWPAKDSTGKWGWKRSDGSFLGR